MVVEGVRYWVLIDNGGDCEGLLRILSNELVKELHGGTIYHWDHAIVIYTNKTWSPKKKIMRARSGNESEST